MHHRWARDPCTAPPLSTATASRKTQSSMTLSEKRQARGEHMHHTTHVHLPADLSRTQRMPACETQSSCASYIQLIWCNRRREPKLLELQAHRLRHLLPCGRHCRRPRRVTLHSDAVCLLPCDRFDHFYYGHRHVIESVNLRVGSMGTGEVVVRTCTKRNSTRTQLFSLMACTYVIIVQQDPP